MSTFAFEAFVFFPQYLLLLVLAQRENTRMPGPLYSSCWHLWDPAHLCDA